MKILEIIILKVSCMEILEIIILKVSCMELNLINNFDITGVSKFKKHKV